MVQAEGVEYAIKVPFWRWLELKERIARRRRHGGWIMERYGHGHAAGGDPFPGFGERVSAFLYYPLMSTQVCLTAELFQNHRVLIRKLHQQIKSTPHGLDIAAERRK